MGEDASLIKTTGRAARKYGLNDGEFIRGDS